MKYFVGLDASHRRTPICVVDEEGRFTWQGEAASDPQSLFAALPCAKIFPASSITQKRVSSFDTSNPTYSAMVTLLV